MKFKQYLCEERSAALNDFAEKTAAKRILTACGPYLKDIRYMYDSQEAMLFRGLGGLGRDTHDQNDPDVVIKKTVKNRTPKDTPNHSQRIMDAYFLENFGHKFRSDQVMFATGSSDFATCYGREYVVFPIGNYKYCWSKFVNDLSLEIGDQATKEEIIEVMDEAHYQTTDMIDAIMSEVEIMIACERYICVSTRKIGKRREYDDWREEFNDDNEFEDKTETYKGNKKNPTFYDKVCYYMDQFRGIDHKGNKI